MKEIFLSVIFLYAGINLASGEHESIFDPAFYNTEDLEEAIEGLFDASTDEYKNFLYLMGNVYDSNAREEAKLRTHNQFDQKKISQPTYEDWYKVYLLEIITAIKLWEERNLES